MKQGDELVFMIRKTDALDARASVYCRASQKAEPLNVDSAVAFDALQRQSSLVLLALMLLEARMLWKDQKKRQ